MITGGKVVTVNYRLTNEKGDELEKTKEGNPFTYLHGAKNIILGLEAGLEGLKVGDKKKITVPPDQAYGDHDENLRATMERSQFPDGMAIELGDHFRLRDGDDMVTIFEVKKVDGDTIHVDANHPLAGMTLTFEVEVVGVRDATADEQKHGHVHTPGDDHHHDHDDHDHAH